MIEEKTHCKIYYIQHFLKCIMIICFSRQINGAYRNGGNNKEIKSFVTFIHFKSMKLIGQLGYAYYDGWFAKLIKKNDPKSHYFF